MCLVVRQLLFDPDHTALLVVCELVQIPQRVLDTLDRSNRIRGIQVCGIRRLASHKHVRNALIVLKRTKARDLAPAENLEAPKNTARLKTLIVTPRENGEGQCRGRLLPRTLAGENAVAHGHTELV